MSTYVQKALRVAGLDEIIRIRCNSRARAAEAAGQIVNDWLVHEGATGVLITDDRLSVLTIVGHGPDPRWKIELDYSSIPPEMLHG